MPIKGYAAVFQDANGKYQQTPFFFNRDVVAEYIWTVGRQWGEHNLLLYRITAIYKRQFGVATL